MKKLLAVVLVLAAFAAVGSVVLGNLRARSTHKQMIEGIEQEAEVRIVEESFAPGLLESTSRVRLEIPESGEKLGEILGGEAQEAGPALAFRVDSRIEHGILPVLSWLGGGAAGTPVVSKVHTTLALDGVAKQKLGELIGEPPALEIETVVRASGVGESRFHLRPHRVEGSGEMGDFTLDWKGLEGQMVFTEDLGNVAGTFSSGGIDVDAIVARVGIEGISSTVDYATDGSGLPVGGTVFTIDSVTFEPTLLPAPAVAMNGWEMRQETRIEGGRFAADFSQKVESVTVGEDVYGPGLIDFALRNLDAASLGETRETIARLQGGEMDEAARAQLGSRMLEQLPALAAHSPELELKEISLATPQGLVRGALKFVVDGQQPELLQNPITAVAALSANASAEMPAPVFAAMVDVWARKQVAARAESGELSVGRDPEETLVYVRDSLIHNLRRSGYVVFDGERYKTRAVWRQGALTLNGIPVNPMELGMSTVGPDSGGAGGGLSFPGDSAGTDSFEGEPFPAELLD